MINHQIFEIPYFQTDAQLTFTHEICKTKPWQSMFGFQICSTRILASSQPFYPFSIHVPSISPNLQVFPTPSPRLCNGITFQPHPAPYGVPGVPYGVPGLRAPPACCPPPDHLHVLHQRPPAPAGPQRDLLISGQLKARTVIKTLEVTTIIKMIIGVMITYYYRNYRCYD